MKDLHERCTKLYNALPSERGRYWMHASAIDDLEAFARKIRSEALEEAAKIIDSEHDPDEHFYITRLLTRLKRDILALIAADKEDK